MKKWLFFLKASLKKKAILIFFLLFVLPAVIIGIIVSVQSNNVLKQQILDTTHRNLNNIESKFMTVINDVEEISSYIIFSDEFRKFMTVSSGDCKQINQLKKNISGFFTFHLSDKNYFNSVTIDGMNDESIHVGEPLYGDESTLLNKVTESRGEPLWSQPYSMTSGWTQSDKNIITLSRRINDIQTIVDSIGIVRIRLDADELFYYVTDGFMPYKQEAFFLSSDGEVIGENITTSRESKF